MTRNTKKRHHPHTQGFLSKRGTTHRSKAGRAKLRRAKDRRRSLNSQPLPALQEES